MADPFGFDDDNINQPSSASRGPPATITGLPPISSSSSPIEPGPASSEIPIADDNNADAGVEGATSSSGGGGGASLAANLRHSGDRLFAILDSQAGILAFVLFLIFSFLVTGSVDWTASFALFALAARMAVHVVVSLWRWEYGDVACCALGVIIICVGLPFIFESTAGAGVAAYLLLVLPQYTEEALMTANRAAPISIYRKRAVQVVGLFAPIAVAIYSFFQLRGGFFYHFIVLLVAIVFILSYVLRAMRLPIDADDAPSPSTAEEGDVGANSEQQQQNAIPGFSLAGIMNRVTGSNNNRSNNNNNNINGDVEMIDPNDPVARVISTAHEYKDTLEEKLRGTPAAYRAYLHIHRPYTTAVCALLMSLLLVVNVATDVPIGFDNSTSVATTTTTTTTTMAPSGPSKKSDIVTTTIPPTSNKMNGRFAEAVSAAPATTTKAPAVHAPNDGGNANPDKPFSKSPNAVYSPHYYVSVGLVSAFLIFTVEILSVSLLDDKDAPIQGKMSEAYTPRYRRFTLLAFAFILAFFPATWKMYPAALALSAVVPWLVWRDASSSGSKAGAADEVLPPTQEQVDADALAEQQQQEQMPPRANSGPLEDGSGANPNDNSAVDVDPYYAPTTSSSSAGRNNNSRVGGPVQLEALNERVVTDFVLPTVLTGLLLILATGAEDKKPATFLDFVAIFSHGAMSYFLFLSLKNFNPNAPPARE